MSSRGLWFKLSRGSARSTSVLALAAILLVVAGATGLQRVAASLLPAKAKVANATPARHLMGVTTTAENSLPQAKIVGVVEGKFDAKSQKISLLNGSSKDFQVGVNKVRVNSYGRVDANTLLPNGSYSLAFARSCANPSGVAGCQSTAPNATVSAEFQITNTGTRKFYNTRQIFADFRDVRGGIPITANAFFNDGQVPVNGQLGVSRDFGDIDPNGGSQARVWSFYFPAGSLTNFYFRYVIYADIGVATESVEPAAVPNNAAQNITITGQGFSSPSVELLNASGASVATLAVGSSSATQIVATVPVNTTPGIYGVRVTNGGETAGGLGSSTLSGRLTVTTAPDAGHTGTFSALSDAGPYFITGNSTLSGTVLAGTVVYVENGVTLQIGSGLTADGGIPGVPSTSPAQIVFTRKAGGTSWGGLNATASTGDVTLRNCVVEFGGTVGGGQIDISGSTRTLRFTDSISRKSAGLGIKATGTDDKFTGFTRSRVEGNAGVAILLSANASLGNGAGMADLNSAAASTSVPDQGYYYSSANVIRNNGVNAIQIDAAANDFTKSGVLVGQGDIPIQILGSNANPAVVGNSSGPAGAELNINPNALIQLAAGMDLKAGDGTLFGNIAANGYAGWSHSTGANTGISQRITFDKIPGNGNFGALYFSSKSAASSILNFVQIQNGGSSGIGSAQLIVDNITYSFKFTNSNSTSSSSYGIQYRSDSTVDKSNSALTGNATGSENVITISGPVTLSTIVGASFGDGLQGNKATIVKPTSIAVDPSVGVYFVDINENQTMIRFLNTTNSTVKVAGIDVPANAVKALTTGVSLIGFETPDNSDISQVDFLTIKSIALSEDRKILYVTNALGGYANVIAINVSPGVAKGSGIINIKNTANTGVDVPVGNARTVYDFTTVATALKVSDNDAGIKSLAVSPVDGAIYLADNETSKVIRIAKTNGATSVFAGTGTRPRNADWVAFSSGVATSVTLYAPTAVTVGSDGVVYIADGTWARVIRVQSGNAQLVTQLGNFDSTGKFDLATNPTPSGLALLNGSLYISNSVAQTIVRIDNPTTVNATSSPSGGALNINNPPVNLVAGTLGTACDFTSTVCGDGGAYGSAGFQLTGLNGNLQTNGTGLYIADQALPSRGRIRYLNLGAAATIAGVSVGAGNIQTVGGAGFAFPYDGGLALSARFENNPIGVAVDASNNLWVSEAKILQGSRLRFVNRGNSTITMLGQSVPAGGIITVNKDVVDNSTDESTTPNNAYFYTLQGLTATAEGIYIVDSNGKSVPDRFGKKTSKLRFINTSGSPVTFYSGSGTPITVPVGEIRTIAGGSLDPSGFGDGGFATSAKLFGTTDIAIHPTTGDIYLSESANKKIRKISRSTGIINSVSGITDNVFTGLAFDASGRLHIAVYNTNQILRGTDSNNTSFSAVAAGSSIKGPRDIAVDASGNIYVKNGFYGTTALNPSLSQIIKIPTSGLPSVFVSTTGTPGFGGDGGAPDVAAALVDFGLESMDIDADPNAVALFEQNSGIAISSSGEVIFADTRNNRVRRVK